MQAGGRDAGGGEPAASRDRASSRSSPAPSLSKSRNGLLDREKKILVAFVGDVTRFWVQSLLKQTFDERRSRIRVSEDGPNQLL